MAAASSPEPPRRPDIDPEPESPGEADDGWRKVLWVALSTVVVAPVAWLPSLFVLAIARLALGGRIPSDGSLVALLCLPIDLVITVAFVRWGLRRGWYLRPANLWGWAFGAAGVVAGIAVFRPAFARVRYAEQEKAALSNARALAAAADQYFLDYRVTSVARSELVGPTHYLRALNPVAGEQYPSRFTQGVTITVSGVAGARTVTYAP